MKHWSKKRQFQRSIDDLSDGAFNHVLPIRRQFHQLNVRHEMKAITNDLSDAAQMQMHDSVAATSLGSWWKRLTTWHPSQQQQQTTTSAATGQVTGCLATQRDAITIRSFGINIWIKTQLDKTKNVDNITGNSNEAIPIGQPMAVKGFPSSYHCQIATLIKDNPTNKTI